MSEHDTSGEATPSIPPPSGRGVPATVIATDPGLRPVVDLIKHIPLDRQWRAFGAMLDAIELLPISKMVASIDTSLLEAWGPAGELPGLTEEAVALFEAGLEVALTRRFEDAEGLRLVATVISPKASTLILSWTVRRIGAGYERRLDKVTAGIPPLVERTDVTLVVGDGVSLDPLLEVVDDTLSDAQAETVVAVLDVIESFHVGGCVATSVNPDRVRARATRGELPRLTEDAAVLFEAGMWAVLADRSEDIDGLHLGAWVFTPERTKVVLSWTVRRVGPDYEYRIDRVEVVDVF
ncbi:hypothetical protein DSM104299_00536 [Baekduia alba]|uniref:hypothetical protein n=1 Tax=Baekduia alba TaxID=2997333 RepID=UPI002340F316|nr:hypothetical protein [Baekduia alba]WCB91858.1 hypothetical protein DSM104299_00536 [Baekduia alba]